MEQGGNDKLHAFLDKYDLNTADLQTKYQSKAAQYYRKRLAAIASQQQELIDELDKLGEPSYSEGRLPIDPQSLSTPSSPATKTEDTPDPQNDPFFTYRS